MYWFSLPAIMKGWIDRVLTLGYAFSQEKRYSQGVFKVRVQIKFSLLMEGLFPLWFSLPRTRKPCCPSPLGLLSPCSVQTALMETWMSHCGHCRYCCRVNWLKRAVTGLLTVVTFALCVLTSRMASCTTVASRFWLLRSSGLLLMFPLRYAAPCWRAGVNDWKVS